MKKTLYLHQIGEYGFYSHEIRNTWGCEITIGKVIREETIIY